MTAVMPESRPMPTYSKLLTQRKMIHPKSEEAKSSAPAKYCLPLSIKGMFDDESVAISKQFSAEFSKQAEETGCYYLDAALLCEPDPRDGVHITEESHLKLGRAVAEKIREML